MRTPLGALRVVDLVRHVERPQPIAAGERLRSSDPASLHQKLERVDGEEEAGALPMRGCERLLLRATLLDRLGPQRLDAAD